MDYRLQKDARYNRDRGSRTVKTETNYGKRILSREQANQYRELWYHNGLKVYRTCLDEIGDEYSELIIGSINLGLVHTTRAGAERDLRAIQTIAEVRRRADWSGRVGTVFYTLRWHGDRVGIGDHYEVNHRNNMIGFMDVQFKFDSLDSCRACIDKIGQARLKEIYEVGRSL